MSVPVLVEIIGTQAERILTLEATVRELTNRLNQDSSTSSRPPSSDSPFRRHKHRDEPIHGGSKDDAADDLSSRDESVEATAMADASAIATDKPEQAVPEKSGNRPGKRTGQPRILADATCSAHDRGEASTGDVRQVRSRTRPERDVPVRLGQQRPRHRPLALLHPNHLDEAHVLRGDVRMRSRDGRGAEGRRNVRARRTSARSDAQRTRHDRPRLRRPDRVTVGRISHVAREDTGLPPDVIQAGTRNGDDQSMHPRARLRLGTRRRGASHRTPAGEHRPRG